MQQQDQDNGASTATVDTSTQQDIPQSLPAAAQDQGQDQPVQEGNTVGDALNAFNEQLSLPDTLKNTQSLSSVRPARVFDGLSEDEVPLFKHMSNDAYNRLYPHYLESKKLREAHEALKAEHEKIKGTHFFEQDGAWQLAPEYQQLSQTVNNLEGEANFWREQLENVEAGNSWRKLVLDQQGNVRVSEQEFEATPQARALIISSMTKAHTLHNQYSGQLQNFEQQFKSKHQNYVQSLAQIESKIFNGADMDKLNKAAETKLSIFPPHLQGRQEVKTLAKALVIIDGLLALTKRVRGSQMTNQIKQNISSSSGPSRDSINEANSGNASGKVSAVLDEFKQARMQGLA